MAIQISPSDSATAVEEVVGVVMQCQMILIPGGEGGHGGGLVYLLLDNLTLDGRIESEGTLHDLYTY